MLALPLREVSNVTLEMLEAEPARITLRVRDFLPYVQKLVDDSEDMLVETGTSAVDRLTVIGSTLVLANRFDLFLEVLEQMRNIHLYIDKMESRSADETKILFALGIGWNTLGALLVREDKFDWLTEFLSNTIERDPQKGKKKGWFHHLYAHVYRANLLGVTLWILPSSSHIRDSEYLFKLLHSDENKVRSLLCQFEFVQCLFYRYHGSLPYTDPGYCRFSNDETLPIVQRIMSDNQTRVEFFGDDYDSERLKQCIANQLKSCLIKGHVHHSLWEGNQTDLNAWDIDRLLKNHWRS